MKLRRDTGVTLTVVVLATVLVLFWSDFLSCCAELLR